jgi:hypothetical protein
MLEGGHHGVALNDEAWDRLVTWIDLNTPFHGTWSEIMAAHPMGPDVFRQMVERRRSLLRSYANIDIDYEAIFPTETALTEKISPAPEAPVAEKAAAPVVDADPKIGTTRSIDLGGGLMIEFAYVPKGAINGAAIDAPFWLGKCEITNEQYARFDAQHDTRVEPMHAYQFGIRGYYVNNPKQPVSRVSFERAMDFCRWLESRTGEAFTLPTEDQWEFACRAGASTPFYYGGLDTDFSPYANLGDARLIEFARNTYIQVNLLENPGPYDDWVPKDARFDDGSFLPCQGGHYKPNAWGLHDMHGNVWEWTQGSTACGGSWYDRPKRATANYRFHYATWQRVFNVGFRVMCPFISR